MPSIISRFFARLSGAASHESAEAEPALTVEHEGLTIRAEPERAGDQWRLVGSIVKQDGDTVLQRNFLRADLFPTREEAATYALRKGAQIIDEQGDRLFADGAPSGRA